jgi:tripartite-type tricarboxylate transporter receptor subunit TctC
MGRCVDFILRDGRSRALLRMRGEAPLTDIRRLDILPPVAEGPMNFARLKRRAVITLLGGAAALLAGSMLAAGAAAAQTYPSRPITLVVPFPPGGATDAIARIIQDSMSQSLGQQLVIENIGGAGGMIAAGRAARAAPDGYTVLLHQVALAAGMTLYSNLGFDAEKDFVSIGLINTAASTLAARSTLPPNNIAELVRWMKEPGQNPKIAHPGVGSFGHLAGVLVAEEIGATVTQVPYRGAGPALNDLLAGVADLSSISAVMAGPLVKAGKIKGYAIIGRTRFAGLPDLPTMGEVGYKKLDLDFWHMLLAPAGTPGPIVERLNAALRHALADAKVRKVFEEGGMDVFAPEEQTPQAARALLTREVRLWGDVIRANNIAAH